MHNVLYINEVSWIGGAEGALLDLASNLDYSRITPIAVCPEEGDFPNMLREQGIITYIVGFYGLKAKNPLRYFSTISGLYSIIKKHNINIIHINQQYFCNYGAVLKKITRLPLIIHFRGVEDDAFLNANIKNIFKADMTICVSHAVMNRIISFAEEYNSKKAGIINKRIVTVYDGIKQPCKGLSPALIKRKYNIPGNRRIIGIIGQVTPEKGIMEFVEASEILLKKYNNLHFLVVGKDTNPNGSFDNLIRQAAEQMGLSQNFTFTGFIKNAASLLPIVDISVLASRMDAFPRIVLESMSAGVPVVATNVGGVPEMIEHSKNGILATPKDSAALANGIETILNMTPVQRARLISAAKSTVGRFSVKSHVDNISAIYDEVVSGKQF